MRLGLGIGLQYGHRAGGGALGPANTVAPAITGTTERGELLTCSTGTWTGTGPITYAYQWRRNGIAIAGATSNTYTLVAADDNATITCIVTATDSEGSRAASSNAVGPVLGAPLNLTAPVLTGTETVGETLSVTAGTWQGQATITFAYQWRRNGSNISGATSSTYTLVAADYDAVIDCVVTATNSLDSASADSNDTGAIAGLAPTNDVAPSISGSTGLGDTLTRVAGTWSGVPTPSIAGQWRRNGTPIAGETGTTYTIAVADSGADIDYLETATNAIGSASADSNNITAQTFAAPTIGAGLSIAGTEEVGETLTATAAAVTGNPTPVRTWQWQRSADGSTGWADISGATSSTYVLDAADETNYVRVKQIETNALGSDEAVSAASGEITAGGATGILDSYTGAAFAFAPDVLIYGAHSVTDNAAGSATNGQTDAFTVRVRRSNDNAVSSFTYTEVSDGTLTTWVGAGNDGFVEAAYDQGTNGNHATQSTAANQPKIVDNGSLVVENGKAALNLLDNSGTTNQQHLAMPFIFGAADTYSAIVSVFTLKGSGNFTHILGSDPADKGFVSAFNSGTGIPRTATIRTDIAAQNATNPIQLNTPTLRVDAANRVRVITRIDANEVINITDNNQNYQTATETLIGNNVYDIITANINFQTLVIYTGNTDRASQIPDIETALNDYYSIY